MVLQSHGARREEGLESPHGPCPYCPSTPSPAARLALLKWRLPARLQPGRITWPSPPVIASAGQWPAPKSGQEEGAGLIQSDGPSSQSDTGARRLAGEGRGGAVRSGAGAAVAAAVRSEGRRSRR